MAAGDRFERVGCLTCKFFLIRTSTNARQFLNIFTSTCEISLEKVNRTPTPKQQSPKLTAGLLCQMFAFGQTSGVFKNSQWEWSLQPPKTIVGLSQPEARRCAGRFLQFFNENNEYFGENSYCIFKKITPH